MHPSRNVFNHLAVQRKRSICKWSCRTLLIQYGLKLSVCSVVAFVIKISSLPSFNSTSLTLKNTLSSTSTPNSALYFFSCFTNSEKDNFTIFCCCSLYFPGFTLQLPMYFTISFIIQFAYLTLVIVFQLNLKWLSNVFIRLPTVAQFDVIAWVRCLSWARFLLVLTIGIDISRHFIYFKKMYRCVNFDSIVLLLTKSFLSE